MANGDFRGGQQTADMSDLTVSLNDRSKDIFGGAFKRLFDIVFSLTAIVAFGTLMLVIAALLKIRTGGPILYRQQRIGSGGKAFACLKFRTMVEDAEIRLNEILETDPEAAAEFAATFKLRNDPRIIPGVGVFLRKTSLDELPQFFNVLSGKMSVVGPRPVTSEELHKFYGAGHPYVSVRPGITGPWQTSGRNDVSFAERVRMDTRYIQNRTWLGDIRIIFRTVAVVCLDRDGH